MLARVRCRVDAELAIQFSGSGPSSKQVSDSTSLARAPISSWSMPAQTWDWYVAYAFQKSELGGHTCVSLFDG